MQRIKHLAGVSSVLLKSKTSSSDEEERLATLEHSPVVGLSENRESEQVSIEAQALFEVSDR